MNEHYLLNADYDERLYTMCHEMGHGYGLPHTDENFNNQDQGNCLDYTNRPANNLRPGAANCDRLLDMYGSIDGTIIGNRTGGRRSLRYNANAQAFETDDADYYYDYGRAEKPKEIAEIAEYDEAMRDFHYQLAQGTLPTEGDLEDTDNLHDQQRTWRRLHLHSRGGAFSRQLNDNMLLEVHVVYPRDWNESANRSG